MKKAFKLLICIMLPLLLGAQGVKNIEWTDVSSDYELPDGLRLFHGTISGNSTFFAYYYEVDMTVPEIAVRPYLNDSNIQVDDFSAQVGAYGAINGGFFSGNSSVSSVIFPNEVPARNLISVVRGGQTFPVIRPVFAIENDRSPSTQWVYHHSYAFDDIYLYDEPMDYDCNDTQPLPVPVKEDGVFYEDVAYGLGGGPMLVKDGEPVFTYCEEIWWGSGVDLNVNRPRTAVGYTLDDKVIMLVTNSLKVEELPELMLDLGCHGAINLDGGGSTAMAAGSESIYDQGRAVPTILGIVHSDSLYLPETPLFEKFIDTGDEGVTSSGNWFETANPGSWDSPSMLHELASHDMYYEFPLNLPAAGEYEIYSWWTSHSNRASDTPYFITHAQGTDQIAVDQSVSGSMWNLIGTFEFEGSQEETVRITAGATTNDFVVADAIRVVSYDEQFLQNTIVAIHDVEDISVPIGTSEADALELLQENTTIDDAEGNTWSVELDWSVENYDAHVAADYTATGTFELPEEVEQTSPPTPLEVKATITIMDDDTYLSEPTAIGLEVYPNPGKGVVNIAGNTPAELTVKVIAMDGREVYRTRVEDSFNERIDLSAFGKGLYLLFMSGEQGLYRSKIVIQ